MALPVRRSPLVVPALVLVALLAFPVSASAAGTTLTQPGAFDGPGQEFCGTYTGTLDPGNTGVHSCDLEAFMIGAAVDGVPTVVYSTRFDRPIGGLTSTGTEVDFAAPGSGYDDTEADQAARVLANYYPNDNPGLPDEYQIEGTDDQKAAAVQAALWHIGDDLDMDLTTEAGDPTVTDFVTFANYQHILAAVADRALPTGTDELTIVTDGPADGSVATNGLFGPFTVNTNGGGSVEYSTDDDIRLTDSSGETVSSVMDDGDTFWVAVPGVGEYQMEGETTGVYEAEVAAWHVTTAQAELAMPMAAATSSAGRYVETITFTVYAVEAGPADAVATEPQFTG